MTTKDAPAPITPKLDFAAELTGLFDLSGKTAFVPGGTGGLGEAIAWGLGLAGASVVIAGRERGKAERLAGAIEAGAKVAVAGVAIEVTDTGSIEAATAEAHERLGRIDILVNCVGIQIEEPLLEVREASFDRVYAVNLKSAMFLAQAAAKRQVAAGAGGRQIHLLSVRSQLALRGKGYSAYCTTKGGLVMLVRQYTNPKLPQPGDAGVSAGPPPDAAAPLKIRRIVRSNIRGFKLGALAAPARRNIRGFKLGALAASRRGAPRRATDRPPDASRSAPSRSPAAPSPGARR